MPQQRRMKYPASFPHNPMVSPTQSIPHLIPDARSVMSASPPPRSLFPEPSPHSHFPVYAMEGWQKSMRYGASWKKTALHHSHHLSAGGDQARGARRREWVCTRQVQDFSQMRRRDCLPRLGRAGVIEIAGGEGRCRCKMAR